MSNKTAIVTGSNSGLGFETCRQLGLRDDFATIFMAARTQEKADKAKNDLIENHGINKDKLKTFIIDVSSIQNSKDATDKFIQDNPNIKIDLFIGNAGRVGGSKLELTAEGYNVVYAASLFGHYIMTIKFLKNSIMSENSTIVFAGSELSRGGITGMNDGTDFNQFAKQHFNNNISKSMLCTSKGESPSKFDGMGCYADAKKFSNWVIGALARTDEAKEQKVKLFCVSPGNVPGTNATSNLDGFNKIMVPIFVFFMKMFGKSHTVDKGAQRYIDAMDLDMNESGKFYASREGALKGPVVDNNQFCPEFSDRKLQDACLEALETITGEELE